MPDRDIVGSLAWAEATDGRSLTVKQRLAMIAPILTTTAHYLVDRLRLATGRTPRRLLEPNLRLPDSALARAAVEACEATLDPTIARHSIRTFAFGSALAAFDGLEVDDEELFVASMMHDVGIATPDPAACFAVRGGRAASALALANGCSAGSARRIAEAVTMHATPHIDAARFPLAASVAGGALVDVLALRGSRFSRAGREQTFARYPLGEMKTTLQRAWLAECKAVPGGRAAAIQSLSLFTTFVGLCPWRDGAPITTGQT